MSILFYNSVSILLTSVLSKLTTPKKTMMMNVALVVVVSEFVTKKN